MMRLRRCGRQRGVESLLYSSRTFAMSNICAVGRKWDFGSPTADVLLMLTEVQLFCVTRPTCIHLSEMSNSYLTDVLLFANTCPTIGWR